MRPFAYVLKGVGNLAEHQADLGHEGLLVGLVQVGPKGVAQRFFPFLEGTAKGLELLFTELDVAGCAAGEEGALLCGECLDTGHCGVGDGHIVCFNMRI